MLKSDKQLSITDICELVGDFEKSPHYSVNMVYDDLNRMFEFLKRTDYEFNLRLKLQWKAASQYALGKGRDFGKAFVQELIAGMAAEVLDQMILRPAMGLESKDSIFVKKLKDPTYYEDCLKNAINSFKSANISDENVFGGICVSCVTNMNVSLNDLIDFDNWSSSIIVKALSGCSIGIMKDLLTNYRDDKGKRSDFYKNHPFWGRFSVNTLEQLTADLMNKIISNIVEK